MVIASYLAIIFALVCPQDFRSSHAGYIWIALAAFMIRTFLFHLGLFLSLITLVAGVARRWWLLGAAIPLVLFTVGPTLWSYRPRHAPVVAGETITVMSVNLLHANTTTGPIAAEIVAAQPDVLVLQEYTPRWHRAFQAALAVTYPHVSYVCRNDSFGQAIYARRPFGGPVNSDLPIGTVGLPEARAVIRLGERNVALYNVHLMPPKRHAWTIEQRWEFADLLSRREL